jgi:hypothetical protein
MLKFNGPLASKRHCTFVPAGSLPHTSTNLPAGTSAWCAKCPLAFHSIGTRAGLAATQVHEAQAASDAMRRWRFMPGTVGAVLGDVTRRFPLDLATVATRTLRVFPNASLGPAFGCC